MTRILLYPLGRLTASDARLIERVLGVRPVTGDILPLCSPELSSQEAAAEVRAALAAARFPGDLHVVETAQHSDEGCERQEALRAAREHEEAKQWVKEHQAEDRPVSWSVHALPWCWAVIVRSDQGIPPGIGFLVDRTTRQVIPHRLVDVLDAIESGAHEDGADSRG